MTSRYINGLPVRKLDVPLDERHEAEKHELQRRREEEGYLTRRLPRLWMGCPGIKLSHYPSGW